MQSTFIRIPVSDAEYIKTIIIKKTKKPRNNRNSRKIVLNDPDYFVSRVFNNGSWEEQGGRYHGGWWQRISGDLRVCITLRWIKGAALQSGLFSLHIIILYAMEGIDYWDKYSKDNDPYTLPDYEQSDRMRGLLKQSCWHQSMHRTEVPHSSASRTEGDKLQ